MWEIESISNFSVNEDSKRKKKRLSLSIQPSHGDIQVGPMPPKAEENRVLTPRTLISLIKLARTGMVEPFHPQLCEFP